MVGDRRIGTRGLQVGALAVALLAAGLLFGAWKGHGYVTATKARVAALQESAETHASRARALAVDLERRRVEDARQQRALADSTEVWESRVEEAKVRSEAARSQARRRAVDLRATLDSAQAVAFDSVEALHSERAAADSTRIVTLESRLSASEASDRSARLLLAIAEARGDELQSAYDSARVASDLKDAIIERQAREIVRWRIATIGSVTLNVVQIVR